MRSIHLQDVTFTYPSGTKAVDNVSLFVAEGERLAIIGQNGAGKTTTVKLMNGLYKPQKGKVLVNGEDTAPLTTAQISRKVGYVFQNPDDQIFNSTVRNEIEYWMKYNKLDDAEIEARTQQAAKLCGISELLDINPYEIPFSQKRFITIASVIVSNPDFIVLDEPTAGQDFPGLKVLVNLLEYFSNKKIGCITISHDMEFVAENFQRVVVMTNHKVGFDGNTEQAFENEELLRSAHIKKPVIAEVAQAVGIPDVLTVEDMVSKILGKEKYA